MHDKITAVNDEEILSANFDGEDLDKLHEVSEEDRRRRSAESLPITPTWALPTR